MTVVWILLGILFFFALLLALPLRIFLRYTEENGLQYRVKYAFLPLADSEKPKKTEEVAAKKQKDTAEKPKKASGGAVQRRWRRPSLVTGAFRPGYNTLS